MNYFELILGFVIGSLGTYFSTRLIDRARKSDIKREEKRNFRKVEQKMPLLFKEMKEALEQTNWQCYEFVILREFETFNTRVEVLRFSEKTQKYLIANLRILEGFNFVREITFNNTPRYQFEQSFIELLKKWEPEKAKISLLQKYFKLKSKK